MVGYGIARQELIQGGQEVATLSEQSDKEFGVDYSRTPFHR